MSDQNNDVRITLLGTARTVLFLTILLIVILGFGSVYFLYANGQQVLGGIIAGVTTSLLAYVVADWLNSTLVQQHAQKVVDRAIQENVAAAFSRVSTQQQSSVEVLVQAAVDRIRDLEQEGFFILSRHFPDFLPANVFPPSNTSNPQFTKSLSDAVATTKEFYFKGITARHLPIFIETQRPADVRFNVLILDPRLDQQIWLYAVNRYATEENLFARRAELIKRVRFEIYFAIMALWDQRNICPINIKLHNGPVFYRTEMFDDRALVSFYVGSERTVYPISYEYKQGSFYYRAFRRDIQDSLSLQTPTLEMLGGTGDERLIQFLREIGCDLSIEELRAGFGNFREEFLEQNRHTTKPRTLHE